MDALAVVSRGLLSTFHVVDTVVGTANKRAELLVKFKERLQNITTANGYRTNAGNNVEIGLKTPNETPDDGFPKLWIYIENEAIAHFATSQKESEVAIGVFGYVRGTVRENLDTDLQALAEDVIQCIFRDERLDSTVDYPNDFEIETDIDEPYGILAFTIPYIFERNQ